MTNPLLTESTLPYHLPPFAAIKDEHFSPAFEQGMAENLQEVDSIAGNPAAATFENTIVALERAGRTLDRVQTIYGIFGSTMNGPEVQAVQREMAPRLTTASLSPVW